MPLPTSSVPWPPKQLDAITPKLQAWSAWWAGDPTTLTSLYQRGTAAARTRPSQTRGGVVGAVSRFWWGRPTSPENHRDQTHVPLAADIARTSADLLFSEQPTFTVDDKTTQTHLDDALSDALFATLTGAAEIAAALGGVYLRVTWDKDVDDKAFITSVPADEAWPEFSWGKLRAVTFWKVIARDGSTVWRHLERHEMLNGIGVVQHGLYEGGTDQLGRPVPLTERPETAPLAGSVDADGLITSGRTPGPTVVYIPNTEVASSRAWRGIETADGLGASDFDGVEGMFDNLDEIYGSWMRDIRLAKARILLGKYMLEDNGPGMGASFNLDQEVLTPLKMAASEDGDAPITQVQFAIRYAEHQASAREWTQRAIRSAGYSVESFGDWTGAQMTATEVQSRENRSLMTRGRKLRAWRPALQTILSKLLTVDADVFGHALNPEGLKVAFPDGIWDTPLQRAQTASALRTAEAASTRTLVALANPEWDDTQVDDEVKLILAERGTAVDPFAIR